MRSRQVLLLSLGPRVANITRYVVGLIWVGGAAFNLLVTTRMSGPFEWLEESPVPVYSWFFREVVGPHPVIWIVILAIGEIALGALTLLRGREARIGLAGGALFSVFLVSLVSVYTVVMGPYAVLLAWLSRREYGTSLFDRQRSGLGRRRKDIGHEPA